MQLSPGFPKNDGLHPRNGLVRAALRDFPRSMLVCLLAVFLVLMVAPSVWAQRNRPLIQFGDLRGSFGLRYEKETIETSGNPLSTSFPTDRKTEFGHFFQELSLRQRLAVLHPRFIDIRLSGDFLIGQGRYSDEDQDIRINNYRFFSDILRYHAIATSLEYSRQQSSFEQSPAAVSAADTVSSAIGLNIKERIGLPMPINLRYSVTEVQSDNLLLPANAANISEPVLQFNQTDKMTTLSSARGWGDVFFSYKLSNRAVERTQLQGTLNTITTLAPASFEEDQVDVTLSGKHGENGRVHWNLQGDKRTRTGFPKESNSNASESFNVKIVEVHSNTLETFLNLAQHRTEQPTKNTSLVPQPEQETIKSDSVSYGLHHRLYKSLYSVLRFTRQTTLEPEIDPARPDFERINSTQLFRTRYEKLIPDGKVFLRYSLLRSKAETQGARDRTVIDEDHQLVNFNPVTLGFTNIIVSTIQVTDISGTITYQENVDYRVVQSGLQTSIERITGTSIINGQTVLVDYTYEREIGDIESSVRSYSLSVQWRSLEPFYQVSVSEEEQISGPLGTQDLLNPGRITVYGIVFRDRFWNRLTAELRIERENNNLRLDPFRRTTTSGSVDMDIGVAASLMAFFRRIDTDHLENGFSTVSDTADSESSTNGLEYRFTWMRLTGLLTTSETENRVGTITQDVSVQSVKFDLPYGKWILNSTLRRADEVLTDLGNNSPPDELSDRFISMGMKRFF